MNKQQMDITDKAKQFIEAIYQQNVKSLFVFHNLEHTSQVAAAADEIARFYQFTCDEQFILKLAALFHDTGFSSGKIEGHEIESVKIAKTFLTGFTIEAGMMEKITGCITATCMPQQPSSGIEKVICDADLFHLGTSLFNNRTELLRQELQSYYHDQISKEEWRQENIRFFETHQYFTGYCQQKLEPIKQKWIETQMSTVIK